MDNKLHFVLFLQLFLPILLSWVVLNSHNQNMYNKILKLILYLFWILFYKSFGVLFLKKSFNFSNQFNQLKKMKKIDKWFYWKQWLPFKRCMVQMQMLLFVKEKLSIKACSFSNVWVTFFSIDKYCFLFIYSNTVFYFKHLLSRKVGFHFISTDKTLATLLIYKIKSKLFLFSQELNLLSNDSWWVSVTSVTCSFQSHTFCIPSHQFRCCRCLAGIFSKTSPEHRQYRIN